ncbi:hypothetical protein Salat_2508600 [Sesamum alatum]|uniref:DUF4283 domain-containing protein n=1 Tax=Sesamum alatum TaxID=300844 RepID=A0AAE1XRW1_9LAMI|nr:hypothetical protein Salat_2508600 [Sesamum alatum]
MALKIIENDKLLFMFNHVVDMKRVLDGYPWNFNRNILILCELGDEENPQSLDLNWCPFYVHIHDLPIWKIAKEMAKAIRNCLFKLIKIQAIVVLMSRGSAQIFRPDSIKVTGNHTAPVALLRIRKLPLRMVSLRLASGGLMDCVDLQSLNHGLISATLVTPVIGGMRIIYRIWTISVDHP